MSWYQNVCKVYLTFLIASRSFRQKCSVKICKIRKLQHFLILSFLDYCRRLISYDINVKKSYKNVSIINKVKKLILKSDQNTLRFYGKLSYYWKIARKLFTLKHVASAAIMIWNTNNYYNYYNYYKLWFETQI